MSDKQPINPTPIDPDNPPEPIKDEQDKTIRELRDVPVEAVPTEDLPEGAQEVKEGESPEVREARRTTEAVLNKPIEALEDTVNAVDIEDQAKAAEAYALPHPVSNTTTLMGYTIPLPIYTVVYITLAAVTLLEILIASLPKGVGSTLFLLAFSLIKAVLVVLFYMHLREDSRIFAYALILPLIIAMVASLFLLTVPIHGY